MVPWVKGAQIPYLVRDTRQSERSVFDWGKNLLAMSKYPTVMSCMEAFDELTSCYSIGGQFRSYYRYGEFNPCQKQLEKLNFCMLHGRNPVKVQEWYRARIEENNKLKGSSDAVWKERG
ncbi:Emi1p KNAG_0F00260 [Huiozyma naganishii CBS 8797]|uniref:Uncharacterized protein n=1 Tax=Huiozyma naganishii (strain ATCC MYA-139 / BCRC 22969 / CBS 8797 / KCTC 17520 / NBRC 10181 / NCYC 3082 / Yp74L-3) TaxID=1071383 RepID=J7RMC8_HUIN7|nr:hypothetical protein KNAG_0F00260 [Kazachstania naganishii CBS 8797]CCK70698.1 hypothetical protein KNAG_0F00260 [Kazachstania naganishii CBS 8797]